MLKHFGDVVCSMHCHCASVMVSSWVGFVVETTCLSGLLYSILIMVGVFPTFYDHVYFFVTQEAVTVTR